MSDCVGQASHADGKEALSSATLVRKSTCVGATFEGLAEVFGLPVRGDVDAAANCKVLTCDSSDNHGPGCQRERTR
jgi:hypothetical protein